MTACPASFKRQGGRFVQLDPLSSTPCSLRLIHSHLVEAVISTTLAGLARRLGPLANPPGRLLSHVEQDQLVMAGYWMVKYCQTAWDPRADASGYMLDYYRPYIREKVLPFIERFGDPDAVAATAFAREVAGNSTFYLGGTGLPSGESSIIAAWRSSCLLPQSRSLRNKVRLEAQKWRVFTGRNFCLEYFSDGRAYGGYGAARDVPTFMWEWWDCPQDWRRGLVFPGREGGEFVYCPPPPYMEPFPDEPIPRSEEYIEPFVEMLDVAFRDQEGEVDSRPEDSRVTIQFTLDWTEEEVQRKHEELLDSGVLYQAEYYDRSGAPVDEGSFFAERVPRPGAPASSGSGPGVDLDLYADVEEEVVSLGEGDGEGGVSTPRYTQLVPLVPPGDREQLELLQCGSKFWPPLG